MSVRAREQDQTGTGKPKPERGCLHREDGRLSPSPQLAGGEGQLRTLTAVGQVIRCC